MRTFTSHSGIAAPLAMDNVETAVIIPMAPLMTTPKRRLGEKVFLPLRYDDTGAEQPDFVLNRSAYRKSSILVAGRNFGYGSSREGAVFALDSFGIRVVIAKSFGDIFYNNCIKNGMLPIVLGEIDHEGLLGEVDAVNGCAEFIVDLTTQYIEAPSGLRLRFEIDPGHKQRLLDGRDEISLTFDYRNEIDAFQAEDRLRRPWVWSIEDGV